ncbi:MAG TPA: hypothetical protein VKB80_16285 [Kofleriaceae bacterium]|nr:hypothetical protein [Kofleriaceae bacterium]
MSSRSFALFAVLLAAAPSAAACGKAVDSSAGGTDAGGGDDGPGSDDGAGDDDGGSAADADPGGGADAAPVPRDGRIYALSVSYVDEAGLPVQSASVEAAFGAIDAEECQVVLVDGACSLRSCTPRELPAEAPDAGAIDIAIDDEPVTQMAPDRQGTYPPFERDGDELFDIGPGLTAQAAGGDVPAFELAVAAPAPIVLEDAVPTSAGAIDVSEAAGYVQRWQPGAETDRIRIDMTSSPAGDDLLLRLSCSVQASVPDLAIAPGLLALLPVGTLDFEARVESEATATAGDYDVSLTAAVVATDAGGNRAKGTINLVP